MLLLVSLTIVTLSSCIEEENVDGEYKVVFVFNDQTKTTKHTVNGKVDEEEIPTQFRYNLKDGI